MEMFIYIMCKFTTGVSDVDTPILEVEKMGWKKVDKLEVRAIGGRGTWNVEKLAEDLKSLEKGYYEMSIKEFMEEYYLGDWKALKSPVLRAKDVLRKVIAEHELKVEAYGSPKNGKIGLKVL